MLKQKNRFHGHKSVSRVRGKRIAGSGFVVYQKYNPKRDDYRMAVVVSKKTAKSAVTRNRIRRRIFEIVRKSKLLENQAYDVVFVVNDPAIATTRHDLLEISIINVCQKIVDHK